MADDTSSLLPPSENRPEETSPPRQLLKLWHAGQPPRVADFLQAAGPLPPLQIAAVLRVDQRQRWQQGERVLAEQYLRDFPALGADREAVLDLVYGEFLLREEMGETPPRDEYLQRFPQYASQLKLQVDLHHVAEDGTQHAADPSQGGEGTMRTLEPAAHLFGTEIAPGRLVAGHAILRVVGKGGMGVVYQARHLRLHRLVALKMIRAGVGAEPEELTRFRNEAEAIARLQHPNIVQIYEVGEHDGQPFVALEFVDGPSLAQFLASAPQPALPAAQLLETLARAIHVAHQRHIVHRDLKPSNILLTADGVAKITDFGLAKAMDSQHDHTATGAILGTPSYMSPEQAQGKAHEVGPAADIYSLGAILYEMLTGHPPFKGASVMDTVQQVVTQDPVAPSRLQPQLPRDLETICLKCLHKEAARRYGSALELAEDLQRFQDGKPIRARPVGYLDRGWRWCRRHPVPAGLIGLIAVLLMAVAVGASVVAVQFRAQRNLALDSLQRAENAEHAQKLKLYEALLEQTRASQLGGHRFASLRALTAAIQTAKDAGIFADKAEELRVEATACLLLSDLEVAKEWDGWPPESHGFAIDPAWHRYARGDREGNVSIRRIDTDEELLRLPGIGVLADDEGIQFSPDGRFLLSQTAKLHKQGTRLWRLDSKPGPTLLLETLHYGVSFRPDGRQMAATLANHSLLLYDLTVQPLPEPKRFPLNVATFRLKLAWNPSPRLPQIAVISANGPDAKGLWQVLDANTGRVLYGAGPTNGYIGGDWHPEGRLLALSTSGTIEFWDVPSAKLLSPRINNTAGGVSVRFNRHGGQMISTDSSGLWRLWDVGATRELLRQPADGGYLQFSADNRVLAADLSSPKIRLYRYHAALEYSSGVRQRYSMYHIRPGVGVDRSGRLCAMQSVEGIVLVDLLRNEEAALVPVRESAPLRFDATGALLTYGKAMGILRWPVSIDAAGAHRYGPPQHLAPFDWPLFTLGCSADGRVIAIPGFDKGTQLLLVNEKRTLNLQQLQQDVRSCAVSPDGRWLATGSHTLVKGAGAKIWDARTGAHVKDLPVAGDCTVSFSPDGQWLLTTGGGLRLWKVGDFTEGPPLQGPTHHVGGAFNADGSLLALEDMPGIIRLVATRTGKEVARLKHPDPLRLTPLGFTPDGSRLLAQAHDSPSQLHQYDLRLLRKGLQELGLDWDWPPLPPAAIANPEPLIIQVEKDVVK